MAEERSPRTTPRVIVDIDPNMTDDEIDQLAVTVVALMEEAARAAQAADREADR